MMQSCHVDRYCNLTKFPGTFIKFLAVAFYCYDLAPKDHLEISLVLYQRMKLHVMKGQENSFTANIQGPVAGKMMLVYISTAHKLRSCWATCSNNLSHKHRHSLITISQNQNWKWRWLQRLDLHIAASQVLSGRTAVWLGSQEEVIGNIPSRLCGDA